MHIYSRIRKSGTVPNLKKNYFTSKDCTAWDFKPLVDS